MSGIVHLRILVTIFVVGGIVSLLPFALSLFMDGVRTSVSQLPVELAVWRSPFGSLEDRISLAI
jgi:hypothetical protein